MQVLGPSLRLVIESYYDERIDPEDLLRLARQVLEDTATLHEAGFAHGGTPIPLRFFLNSAIPLLPSPFFFRSITASTHGAMPLERCLG